jgi:hypothetical protein
MPPTYVREEYHTGAIQELKARIGNLEGQLYDAKLEIHRLDSEKQTEACCTGEMRDDYQRQIEETHTILKNVRKALGPEWDGTFLEDAVIQLKQDHIDSVRIADRVPGLEREIAKLQADQFWYGGRESLESSLRLTHQRAERLLERGEIIKEFVDEVVAGKHDRI